MRHVLCLALVLALPAAAQSLDEWADRLGSPDFEERELAFRELWRAGRAALPQVERLAASDDLEVRERAERLLPLVRWEIGPELHAAVGPELDGFDGRGNVERLDLVRKCRAAGRVAISFLRTVALEDESSAVASGALDAWSELDDPEVLAWVEAAVDAGTTRGVLHAWLGRRYAWLTRAEIPVERLERVTSIEPDWIGALLAAGRDDLAETALAAGLAQDAPGWRQEVARCCFEQGRPERAFPILRGPHGSTCEIVERLLEHRYPELARREALAAPELAGELVETFARHLEFETAIDLARTAGQAERLRDLIRGAMRDPEGPRESTAACVSELLDRGLADEAWALLPLEGDDAALALRAAVAAGAAPRGAPVQGPDPRTRAALVVDLLDRAEGAGAADLVAGLDDELDLATEVFGATADDAVLAAAHVGASGWRGFLPAFDRGRLAELDGRAGDALHHYAKALIDIGTASNVRLAWHAEEVGRKARYLSRVPGALDAALEKAEDPLLRIEILRQSGEWARASVEYDAIPVPEEKPRRLEAAWTHLRAERNDRVAEVLGGMATPRGDDWTDRVRLHLLVLAGREAPAGLERPVPAASAYEAAFFLTCHGLDDPALEEWGRILSDHHAPATDFHFHVSNAWEYSARILWRTGRDPARAAGFLERSMRATTAIPEEGYRILELGGQEAHRARVFLLRSRSARAAGDGAAAFRLARQALGLDPYCADAAAIVLDLAAQDPDFAESMGKRHAGWLERRRRLEPANGELR